MPLNKTPVLYAALAVIASAVVAAAIFAARPQGAKGTVNALTSHGMPAAAVDDSAPVIKFVKDPQAAPDFELTGIDGKPISLSASRGKVTVINFWATWCGPCKMEIPSLVQLQQKYGAQLQVIGLGNDDVPLDEVKKYVAKMGMNYPVAISTSDVEKKYGGVAALPTSFVLDTQGRIVQKHVGVWDLDQFELEVRALAGLPVNAKIETFDDTGQIFLANASRATELPDVDMSKLTPAQKKVALRRLNEEGCPCGCMLTVAQCRINDETCDISKKAAAEIVQKVAQGAPAAVAPAQKTLSKKPAA